MTLAIKAINTFLQRLIGADFDTILEITSIAGPSLTRTIEDVTSMDSQNCYMDFLGTVIDGGQFQCDPVGRYAPDVRRGHGSLLAAPGLTRTIDASLPEGRIGSIRMLCLSLLSLFSLPVRIRGVRALYPPAP